MSHYTAPSQIAERQLAYFSGKKVLIAGEIEDDFPLLLAKHCLSVAVFTTHYGYYRQLQQSSAVNCYFGAELTENLDADLLVIYWPKAKLEAQYLLAMLLAKLPSPCEVIVIGENRSGVKSIEKMFKPYGSIKKYDSARRCSFYWGECRETVADFALTDWFKSYSVQYQQHELTIRSLPGVFSHGEFDLGSQLLLDTLPSLQGKVLDFGCGAGVIGCVMAMLNPKIELEMCDINALAICSSQATLAANGLSGRVFASDIYSDTATNYDVIVSNPPFHSGLETSYQVTETLLHSAPNYLTRSGQLFLVANSFLKYPPIIEQAFGHCETLSKTSKFSIYHASK
ncbi:16S rRNA (guanine(1207)-N(2))-methyltransferase RsmC [Vibrio sp. V27_P1S3P104]|uniref:16S rRNA (guanine(1207)-N(2))-methyltransferase RsmC n=1 Tax=unclassified Vibrio TaxID=2614977 RepID=UPI001372C2F7|nr:MULTISPECIES: 16S rRNA (guanine(1207)-N(2))-methyltransferase RsmC [unclassified Vibrio]NAW68972.1 16S rRNA (guanine(1207)-N(2))-methyltransferase RsmC [Vibrio sp. V28_P6S34P95]NAX04227.1 16S rRNA (guanine(1207)-N(2))-methyltransferase RsmC [Vibrio sp. V30_P3S12P165]NAX33053.1 16S rRNA (guanine(1207)-N(2))-methyltransferase RsmC [Vibrio sp. V29_P1S30P107]NAX38849.1 16S rRNA (guanine(1207)-N(2))-methyltransferase RsmC [Vibrio sp. V27_P1S3P104]NAX39188.1 16S rRNA (guanine(1207)-N(2))-methyltr